jgi:P-type E1-E2 ATPase
MTLDIEIAGREPLHLTHLLLDVNGTLTDRGELIEGVAPRLAILERHVAIQLLTADTFGTAECVAGDLGADLIRVAHGTAKADHVRSVGADTCATVGNGNNDIEMLTEAALGIVILGREGTSPRALMAADVLAQSITEALDLLLDAQALSATLRS